MRLVVGLVLLGTLAAAVPAAAQELPEGEGRELVEKRCSTCHGLDEIFQHPGYTAEDWDHHVYEMSARLRADAAMRAKVVNYLAAHFPPD